MLDLNIFYKNHFDDKQISDNKLRKFAGINLERLTANNSGGEFTQLIADTNDALQEYAAAQTKLDVSFASQQGLTIAVNNLLSEYKNYIGNSEGFVRATFGKAGTEYQEFFPYKKDEYWRSNLKNAEQLMDRFLDAADRHSAELGTGVKNKVQALLTDFRNARKAQLLKKAEVTDSRTELRKKRHILEIQLMKNLLYVGFIYADNPNKCNDFFDQSFLRRKKKKAEQG